MEIQNKLVTILAVVYNQEKYIDDFMQSVINQTYKNIEIIIADDCSTDNSYEKVLSWKEQLEMRFEHVHIVQTPYNMGIVKNLNNALQYVTGEYFKWIACDDILLPKSVEQLADTLNENQQYAMVYSNYYVCTEEDLYNEFMTQEHDVCKPKVIVEKEKYAQALYEDDFIVVPTTMVRWDVAKKLNFFDESIGVEDWGTWIEIALNYEIGYLDEVTAGYRIVGNSLSHFTSDDKGKERLKNMVINEIKILEKFKNHPKINAKAGIFACCEQGISVAIDLEAESVIKIIINYMKRNNIHFSMEMKLKYLFYRLHILSWGQRIKKRICNR